MRKTRPLLFSLVLAASAWGCASHLKASIGPQLRGELLAMSKSDQDARQALIAAGMERPSTELRARMAEIDAANTARIKKIVRLHGWPGKSLVGDDGETAAFLLVQHADRAPAFQRQALPLLRKAWQAGDASGEHLALLTDRVLVSEGKPQLYGSQADIVDGKIVVKAVQDEPNLGKRRAELGLSSMDDYIELMKKAYGLPPDFTTEPAPEYDRLFQRQDGWTGSDVASSIPLGQDRVLWLFGDTWIGKIRGGKHVDAALVSNTVAVQTGLDPATAKMEFHHVSRGGKPAALFSPPAGKGVFWLSHGGIRTAKGLYLFMSRILPKPGDASPFGFKAVGMVLAHVARPDEPVSRWRPTLREIPWTSYSPNGEMVFGMPLVNEGGMIYLYGLEVDAQAGDRFLLVARAPVAELEDFGAWRFFSDGLWQKDFAKASRLADRVGAELSVSYQPFLKKYVAVYTEGGLSQNILMRVAPAPEGPWSAPRLVYKTPETGWDKDYFCYAAKAHPELARASAELIVSYVCNSFDFGKMASDARIYVPKFLRVRFIS